MLTLRWIFFTSGVFEYSYRWNIQGRGRRGGRVEEGHSHTFSPTAKFSRSQFPLPSHHPTITSPEILCTYSCATDDVRSVFDRYEQQLSPPPPLDTVTRADFARPFTGTQSYYIYIFVYYTDVIFFYFFFYLLHFSRRITVIRRSPGSAK